MLYDSKIECIFKNDDGIKFEDLVIEDGKIKGIQGADTVIPFNSGGKARIRVYSHSGGWHSNKQGFYDNNIYIDIDFNNKTITKVSSNDTGWKTIAVSASNGSALLFCQSTAVYLESME